MRHSLELLDFYQSKNQSAEIKKSRQAVPDPVLVPGSHSPTRPIIGRLPILGHFLPNLIPLLKAPDYFCVSLIGRQQNIRIDLRRTTPSGVSRCYQPAEFGGRVPQALRPRHRLLLL
jgi:hypothetical protein